MKLWKLTVQVYFTHGYKTFGRPNLGTILGFMGLRLAVMSICPPFPCCRREALAIHAPSPAC